MRQNVGRYSLHLGDCFSWMDDRSKDSIHAIVTDHHYRSRGNLFRRTIATPFIFLLLLLTWASAADGSRNSESKAFLSVVNVRYHSTRRGRHARARRGPHFQRVYYSHHRWSHSARLYYAHHRERDPEQREKFERITGYPSGRPGYVVDHVVPLACGGADDPSNMQWQTVEGAKAKDKTERRGCQK